MVLNPPRRVPLPRVHDERRRPQVAHVGVRVLAVVVLHRYVRKEAPVLDLILRERVPAQQRVVVEVVDDDLGRRVLLSVLQDLGGACVHHPEPAASVGTHAEGRDYFRGPVGSGPGQAVRLPVGVGTQLW